jgi:hypothetical protein
MSVAPATEISATSEQSFEEVIRQGLERVTRSCSGGMNTPQMCRSNFPQVVGEA